MPKLIQVAQGNKNPEVRKQAMFWVGQSTDPRALEFLAKVLTQQRTVAKFQNPGA